MEFLKKHARLPRLAMESERYTSVYSLLHKMPLDDSEEEPPAISVSALGGDRDPMNRCAAPLPPTPLALAVLPPPSPCHALLRCPTPPRPTRPEYPHSTWSSLRAPRLPCLGLAMRRVSRACCATTRRKG